MYYAGHVVDSQFGTLSGMSMSTCSLSTQGSVTPTCTVLEMECSNSVDTSQLCNVSFNNAQRLS